MLKESDGLVGHGSILLTATIISGVANYFFHFYMIRALGPEDYGILFPLLAILMIVGVPVGSVRTVIAKYVSSFKAKKQTGKIAFLFFHSIRRLLVFSTLVLVIFIILSGQVSTFLRIPSRMPVVIIGFILFVSFLSPPALGTLQGLQRFTLLGFAIILGAILRVVFGVFIVHFGFRVNGALAASFFSSLTVFLVALVPLYILFKREHIDNNVETGEIHKFYVPTFLAFASFSVLTYIDVPLVKHFFSPLEAGYYSTAAIVGKAFLFPAMALAGAMFPKLSGYSNKSRFLFNKTLLLSLFILISGILICLFFPKFILIILMKKKDLTPLAFSTTIPLLRLFGIAMSPFALTHIVIHYNVARHKTRFLYFLLAGTLLQVILLSVFHTSLLQVLFILSLSGLTIFAFLFVLTWSKNG